MTNPTPSAPGEGATIEDDDPFTDGRDRSLIYDDGYNNLYAVPIEESMLFVQTVNGQPSRRFFVPALFCDAVAEALIAGRPLRAERQAFLDATFGKPAAKEQAE